MISHFTNVSGCLLVYFYLSARYSILSLLTQDLFWKFLLTQIECSELNETEKAAMPCRYSLTKIAHHIIQYISIHSKLNQAKICKFCSCTPPITQPNAAKKGSLLRPSHAPFRDWAKNKNEQWLYKCNEVDPRKQL